MLSQRVVAQIAQAHAWPDRDSAHRPAGLGHTGEHQHERVRTTWG